MISEIIIITPRKIGATVNMEKKKKKNSAKCASMIIVISHCRHIRFVFAYLFNILGDAAAPQCPMQCITNSRYRYCAYYVIAFHSTAHSTCQCQTQSAPSHASTHATHDRHMTSLALANYGIKSTDQRHHDVLICRFIIIIICYLLI